MNDPLRANARTVRDAIDARVRALVTELTTSGAAS
jgi:hypothetical protein